MKIVRSSTSEISFLVESIDIPMQEQDFIIITEPERDGEAPQKYLAQIEKLIQNKEGSITGSAAILGIINATDHSLSACRFPISTDSRLDPPPVGLISKILSSRDDRGIYLGDVITSANQKEPFLITPNFIERHLLCVATTGAGKSYSIGVLLEEILLKFPEAAVILFDIHNEYWGLALPNDGIEVEHLDHQDYSPRGFLANILIFEKESLGLGRKFDLPRLRRLVDLTAPQENSLATLLDSPLVLEDLIEKIKQSEDMHSATRENLISKIRKLRTLRFFDSELPLDALVRSGQVSLVRLDQFVDERNRGIVVNEILTQLFDQKIRGELDTKEVIIVCEEAHRFSSENDILARISREGRKFGIYTVLVSQRPGDLPDDIIANMNTLIALRVRSDKDLTKIRLMEGIRAETVALLPHLSRGEALIVGLRQGTYRPIKVLVRPRMSKHIDPQIDHLPDSIPRYSPHRQIAISPPVTSVPEEIKPPPSYSPPLIDAIQAFDSKDLSNLLACEHVFILHKRTGLCLFDLSVSMLEIDSQLVSGFLTAISGFFQELKTQSSVKERLIVRTFAEDIGDRAFEIVQCEGEYTVTAVILDRALKYLNKFKQRIRDFVYVFENTFRSQLNSASTSGVIIHEDFAMAIKLLDYFMGFSLLIPLRLDPFPPEMEFSDLLGIIDSQMERVAKSEGLFAEEIVNQCLLDSEYNLREIIQAVLLFLQKGILVLQDKTRTLPPFTETSRPGDLIESSPIEDIKVKEEPLLEKMSVIPPKLSEENETLHIEWLPAVIEKITPTALPNALVPDILERDLIFESDLRIKTHSTRVETLSKTDLDKWARIMDTNGFILTQQNGNPLSGIKLIFESEATKLVCSLAKLKDGDYILILGEIL
ncbi:MAG: ATP-binding protein [Candidatus Thorarchaeota archaeon]